MAKPRILGDLQFAIMQVLWQRRQATVNEVHHTLYEERGLAPTTIATMLAKLEKKGVAAHEIQGRKFVYRPTVTESEVRRSMVGELTDRVFDGDASALVSHLLTEHDIDRGELEELKRQIEEKANREN